MFTAQNYVMASSLEEAYTLNQKKANAILSGGCFLRLSKKRIHTLIDLSALSLDQIEEFDEEFRIGAMVTLRDVETNDALRASFGDGFYEMVRHIVGVQFRNCATIGGSLAARFGFSDILCCLLGLDCDVELYKQGRMPLADFAKMKKDNDILVRVIIKKTPLETVYLSQRNTETDFPVVSCAVTKDAEGYYAVIGARPCQPVVVRDSEGILAKAEVTAEDMAAFASKVQNGMDFADNTRCSGAYRRHVAGVLVKRGLKQLMGGDK